MDRDAENEFKRVWRKLDATEKDGRELARVAESVKFLAKKVDRFSWAVTTLAITVVAELITSHIK